AHFEGAVVLAQLALGALLQVVAFQHDLAGGVGAVAEAAGERVAQPEQRVLGGAQVAVAAGGHRDGDHAGGEPVGVDLGARGRVVLLLLLRGRVVVLAVEAASPQAGGERGGGVGAQRHQVRAAADGERQIEHVRVVDRVERPDRQERQVFAVAGEDGVVVGEPERGHLDGGGAVDAAHLDLGERLVVRVDPGEPGGVGREREPADVAVAGTVQFALGAGLDVDDQEAAVVGGDGGVLAVGRGCQGEDAPELAGGQRADLAAGGADLQAVLAGGVGDPDGAAGGVEHARQPYPDAGLGAEGAGGAVAVGDPVGGAADLDGAGAAGLVRGEPADLGGRRSLGAGRARPAGLDVEPVRFRVQAFQQPEVAGVAVDDPLAVGGGVAGVDLLVAGVPAQVGAVGQGGVDVPGAVAVGQEGDSVADPHGGPVLGGAVGEQAGELSGAFGVDPDLARGAAAVALPLG